MDYSNHIVKNKGSDNAIIGLHNKSTPDCTKKNINIHDQTKIEERLIKTKVENNYKVTAEDLYLPFSNGYGKKLLIIV